MIVSVYYAPLPGQPRCVTGSYEGDIRLNSSGKITASGEKPYIGMVAADPSVLPLGTKIKMENESYSVIDIGGAIKETN